MKKLLIHIFIVVLISLQLKAQSSDLGFEGQDELTKSWTENGIDWYLAGYASIIGLSAHSGSKHARIWLSGDYLESNHKINVNSLWIYGNYNEAYIDIKGYDSDGTLIKSQTFYIPSFIGGYVQINLTDFTSISKLVFEFDDSGSNLLYVDDINYTDLEPPPVTTNFSADLTSLQFYRCEIPYPGQYTVNDWVLQSSTLYKYAVQQFTVSVAGTYTIQTTEGIYDPMLFIYGGSFDPSSPKYDGIVANDDIDFSTYASLITWDFDEGLYTIIVTSYNPNDAGTQNFQVVGPAAIIIASTAAPTAQATNIIFSNLQLTQMDISFSIGDGVKRAVFVKEGSGTITNPTDNATYTAISDWSSKGTQLGTSGYYCVYNGPENSFTITNIQESTLFTVQVFEYNGTPGAEKYLLTTATGNPNNQTSLPVELTSFTASSLDNKVNLNWQTATEVDNYGFVVERSKSSEVRSQKEQNSWEEIGFVNGHGNSNSPKNYSFFDEDVTSGKYLYRLKQIDNDGDFEYSPIVEVEINNIPTQISLEQNYPNPFNPSTVISFQLPVESKVLLKVYDILGKEITTLINEVKEAGNHQVNFSGEGLTSGVYFYSLRISQLNGEKNFTNLKKMLLLR